MKAPTPIWETAYKHDRREHLHRCKCCNRIVEVGEQVFMAKVGNKQTRVVHFKCGWKQHGTGPWTWKDWLADQGVQYLRATGFVSLERDRRGDIKGEFDMSPDGEFTLRATKQEMIG